MRCFLSLVNVVLLIALYIPAYATDSINLHDLDSRHQYVYGIVSTTEWCSKHSPDFAYKINDTYEVWEDQFENEISKVKNYPNYESWIKQTNEDYTKRSKWKFTNSTVTVDEKYRMYATCNDEFIMLLKGDPIPDERFSSPAKTYKLLMKSMFDKDHNGAIICFTSEGISGYLNNILMLENGYIEEEALTQQDLEELLNDANLVEIYIDASNAEVRHKTRQFAMKFKKILGNWKAE